MLFIKNEKSKLIFLLKSRKIDMDQIIKLTTQMATTAITQIIIDKIIANAKNLNENSDFDFDSSSCHLGSKFDNLIHVNFPRF